MLKVEVCLRCRKCERLGDTKFHTAVCRVTNGPVVKGSVENECAQIFLERRIENETLQSFVQCLTMNLKVNE
jgi:hypothetical protein